MKSVGPKKYRLLRKQSKRFKGKQDEHFAGHSIARLTDLGARYKPLLQQAILDGTVTTKQIQVLAQQVYLQEKWPSHIAHVYLNLTEDALADRQLVRYVLSIIQSENLGVGSRGVSHTELARRFAYSMGVHEKSLNSARPTSANQMLMDWCDMSALDRPWLESLAVHIACESQASTMKAIARGLQFRYGKSADDVEFWIIHGGAVEKRHMTEGLVILGHYIRPDNQYAVEHAYRVSCKFVCEFYDSILEV